MSRITRAAGVAAATFAAATLPLLAATPAQADSTRCMKYLQEQGYAVHNGHRDACRAAESGGSSGEAECRSKLQGYGVKKEVASKACELAADDVRAVDAYVV
jgi:hypothetical protein